MCIRDRDIAADNPEEIALAIMAEVVMVYRGKMNVGD